MLTQNSQVWIRDIPPGFVNVRLSTVRHIHVRLEYAFGLEALSFV
jgi:hypothetical protein